MKFVQTLLALALAGGMAGAHAASPTDATFNMGTLNATPYVNTHTVMAGTDFTLPPTGATLYNFTDTYTFTVSGLPAAASTGVAVDLDLGSLSFHISNLKLDLFDAGNTWLAGDIVTGSNDLQVNVNASLSNGNYYFLVRGYADGVGTNQGIYTFTAAAVPEAQTYAMMLAGLGLVGFTVLRRRTL